MSKLAQYKITHPEYNVAKTLYSGQVFRFKEVASNKFEVISLNRKCLIEQNGQDIILSILDPERGFDYWIDYFNFNYDTNTLREKMRQNEFLSKVYDNNQGLFTLNQDPWETLLWAIISQQKRIPQIKLCVEKLAKVCGRYIEEGEFYAMPTPQAILLADLTDVALGYRQGYVTSAANAVVAGWINLNELKADKTDYLSAIIKLTDIYGVGEKVANCVALFGLRHYNAFPIDVHIKRILQRPELKDLDINSFGNDAGLLQQYLFNYAINPK